VSSTAIPLVGAPGANTVTVIRPSSAGHPAGAVPSVVDVSELPPSRLTDVVEPPSSMLTEVVEPPSSMLTDVSTVAEPSGWPASPLLSPRTVTFPPQETRARVRHDGIHRVGIKD
jgi:hypothetical protein